MSPSFVATGLSYGLRAAPEHAEKAVNQALNKAGLSQANSVILFLTSHYAQHPEPAIRSAARAAGCTQVVGCTSSGLVSDEDWVLDSPGAAAMVFGGPLHLQRLQEPRRDRAVLSLCTPQGLSAEWLDSPVPRIGAVTADMIGHGPYSLWAGARLSEEERVDLVIEGAEFAIEVSQGIRALTAPIEVAEAHGFEIVRLGNYPALNVLVGSLPSNVRELEQIPLHLLIGGVTFGDPDTAIREGRYRLNHIVSADPSNRSITLSHPLNPGERLFWAMRDALISERDMAEAIDKSRAALAHEPDFGLLFPCVGRGPSFYGNRDRDVDLLKSQYPKLPFIGIYGNGEIGPLHGANHLHQYSTVLGLFSVWAS
jgi:small ligand-binding sensory domain FIST